LSSLHPLKEWSLQDSRGGSLRIVSKQFSGRDEIYRNVDDLRELRNFLIHYVPEWRVSMSEDPAQLASMRIFSKVAPSRMVPENMPENLDKYFGHGLCIFAVRSSLAFTDEFFNRLGVEASYERFRSTFDTEPST